MVVATKQRELSFHPPRPVSTSGFCISMLELCLRDLCSNAEVTSASTDPSYAKTLVTSINQQDSQLPIILSYSRCGKLPWPCQAEISL